MTLTPAFLDELRLRTTLSALIGKSVKLTRAGREFKACCPFHNEKTPSFYVNDEKGFYHCFGCQAHGDAIRFLTDARGLPFMDAVKELADAAGLEVPAPDPLARERSERAAGLHDVMEAAARWFREQLEGIEGSAARDYLKQRGISDATSARFGFGFSPDSRGRLKAALQHFGNGALVEAGLLIQPDQGEPYDRFRGRLMIPIRDQRGRVIAFGGRILGPGEPKYLNSPETPLFDKGRTLFNLDRAGPASRDAKRVIVVEGYMDVIALDQAGISEAVAPLGTALTEGQLERLWRLSDSPILCFDGDGAGQKAADRAAERALPLLAPGRTLSIVTLPPGHDPDDMIRIGGATFLEDRLNRSETLVSRIFRSEVIRSAPETPEARAGVKKRLLDLAASIQDSLVRDEYRQTLTNMFFESFGWRRKELSAIREGISASRPQGLPDVSQSVQRAVLFGLSRFPEVLRENFDLVTHLHIDNRALRHWLDVLRNALLEKPHLDIDALEAILDSEDVDRTEKFDLTKDLAYTFFRRPEEADRARADLSDLIATLAAERQVAHALEAANARFADETHEPNWQDQQRLQTQQQEIRTRLSELAERVAQATAA